MKYVGSKYQKEFMKDLKPVYGAMTKDAGEIALDKLEQYPIVIKSWRDNWERSRMEYWNMRLMKLESFIPYMVI